MTEFPGTHFNHGFGPNNPPKPPKPQTIVAGLTPGALSSTGGLFGNSGALVIPCFDFNFNRAYIGFWDPTNFNCEEDCIYNFPQENVKVGYAVSSYKIIVIYRNLGRVRVTFFITTFRKGLTEYKNAQSNIGLGSFSIKSKTMFIGSINNDNKLYTTAFNIINSGERPQISILRKANDGPLSIISVTLIGNADETEKL